MIDAEIGSVRGRFMILAFGRFGLSKYFALFLSKGQMVLYFLASKVVAPAII